MIDLYHLRPLVLLELQRAWPHARKIVVFVAVITLVLMLVGKGRLEYLLPMFLGAGLGAGIAIAFGVVRDKLEGTLEFLCNLPIGSGTIVEAKFASITLLVLPWSLASTALIPLLGLPEGIPARLADVILGVLVSSCVMLCLTGWWVTAAWLRYDPETVGLLPGAAIVVLLFGFGFLMDRFGPEDPVALLVWLQRFFGHWWAAPAVVLGLAGLVAVTGAGAFLVARKALRRFEPRPPKSRRPLRAG